MTKFLNGMRHNRATGSPFGHTGRNALTVTAFGSSNLPSLHLASSRPAGIPVGGRARPRESLIVDFLIADSKSGLELESRRFRLFNQKSKISNQQFTPAASALPETGGPTQSGCPQEGIAEDARPPS